MVAAFANMIVYPFTDEYSVILQISLNAVILFWLIARGDKHYCWQIGWLMFAIACGVQFELDQADGTNVILSNYDATIIGITIMQLMGAGYGITLGLFERLRQGNMWSFLPVHSRDTVMVKTWPKK
jgi:hypothetical protein